MSDEREQVGRGGSSREANVNACARNFFHLAERSDFFIGFSSQTRSHLYFGRNIRGKRDQIFPLALCNSQNSYAHATTLFAISHVDLSMIKGRISLRKKSSRFPPINGNQFFQNGKKFFSAQDKILINRR